MTGVRARVARAGQPDDAGVAMLTTLVVIMVLTGLSILVLGMVVAQTVPVQLQRQQTRTVYAAEAGIEAVVAQMRGAAAAADYTGAVYGDARGLPCARAGTLSDSLGDLRYEATVQYFTQDPSTQTAAWRTANALPCSPSYGLTTQPTFARIVSAGTAVTGPRVGGGVGDRSMVSVYRFRTTSVNVPGGRIWMKGRTACLRADALAPGARITYATSQVCNAEDQSLTQWVYAKDYTIKLAASTFPGETPLCITHTSTYSGGATPTSLQACRTDGTRWQQLFSWEGGARWVAENSSITGYATGWCLTSGQSSGTESQVVGRSLHVQNACGSNTVWGSFDPDPSVGAGAASAATKQVVNFLEFGRCFDVTNRDVTWAYMIVYPCKQDPNPSQANLDWNHRWFYDEPAAGQPSVVTTISVLKDNSTSRRYCLSVEPGGVNPHPTLVTPCNPEDARQQWTRYGDTGATGTSYIFVDSWGRCIDTGPRYGDYSTLVAASCTGNTSQKWNAAAQSPTASLTAYAEVYG
ncbi:RICIN domain-containing protein [Cellulomonas endophytica]|uniref:RICIN domain-containing protein n=1 Tax=Cellulomonas endophytica TaxID=2494735 RepID=UPI001010C348|nr:RICIN domain-containing protein [Cellulomonas endophytica]